MRKSQSVTWQALACVLWVGVSVQAGTIEGRITAEKAKWVTDAVVYVDSVSGAFTPPEKHALMDQKNLVFSPRVLPVLAGTTVDFLNSDDVAHNVFSPDDAAGKFNLGTWPTGEKRSYTFTKRCEKVCDAVMLCNVHPEMEAFVLILQNPYFAKVDDSGRFAIENVPAGRHTLQVWHPKRKADAQSVDVAKEGSVHVEFALKK